MAVRAMIRRKEGRIEDEDVEIVFDQSSGEHDELTPERESHPTVQAALDAHPDWPWRKPTPPEIVDVPPGDEVVYVADLG